MSAKLIALAAELVEALDNYDSTVLENYTQEVDGGDVTLTDVEGVVTTV